MTTARLRLLAACAALLLACSSETKSPTPIEKGAAGGACYDAGTCDGALACVDGKCVAPDGG